jgi:hypothetical protein
MVKTFPYVQTVTVRTVDPYRGELMRLKEWLIENLGPQHRSWDLREGQWYVEVRTATEEDDMLVMLAWT